MLTVSGLNPLSIPPDKTRLFGFFARKVAKDAAAEVVEFAELNREIDDPDEAGGAHKASGALRAAIHQLNEHLAQWAPAPDGKPWLGSRKGLGYHLNESVRWSMQAELKRDLGDSRHSVYTLPTPPATLAENTPDRGQRLPARPKTKPPSDPDE